MIAATPADKSAAGFAPAPLSIRQALPSDENRWANFVEAHPQGLIYQHPLWVAALEEEYGGKSCTLLCQDDHGELRGVLSLLDTKGLPFTRSGQTAARLASLPRTPLAGPLALDAAAATALLKAATQRLDAQPHHQLQIRSLDGGLASILPGMTVSPWKEIYVLGLPADPSQLTWGGREKRHRIKGAVNRAIKLGVEVREAESEADLRAWYQLYLETMRWHISPPRPYRFLLSLWNRLRPLGKLRLLLAERSQDGQLLAGYLFLACGRTMHCYLNGRRGDSLPFHPNDLLQWKAIYDSCAQGFHRYDLGEVEPGQKGLAEFKTKWGAAPVFSYRYYYPPPNLLRGPAQNLTRSPLGRLWRYVPLAATAVLGDWLYGYL